MPDITSDDRLIERREAKASGLLPLSPASCRRLEKAGKLHAIRLTDAPRGRVHYRLSELRQLAPALLAQQSQPATLAVPLMSRVEADDLLRLLDDHGKRYRERGPKVVAARYQRLAEIVRTLADAGEVKS